LHYVSTRDAAKSPQRFLFEDVLLAGLAHDGGLYVPERVPSFSASEIAGLAGLSYTDLAARVMAPFIGDAIPPAELRRLIGEAYAGFGHAAVAPLKQLDSGLFLLELFHGPTLAFKDYPLQLVGRLFDAVLTRRRRRVTIIGATSGDTGSAAIEACRDRDAIDVFILYPKGRTSEVQRRQMTTVASPNAHAIAVEGTFDDCQDLVKAMFADAAFRDELGLSAVNSINWARVMAQIVYYFAAAVALGAPHRPVAFTVPTGNFGNVLAAHMARRMGLPIAQLAIGTNRNDILARFLATGKMTIGTVEPSLSPSMDIQVSSNFERLLFELKGGSGGVVAAAMREFRASGTLPVSEAEWRKAQSCLTGHRVDDAGTTAEIARTWKATGELIDPHTAIAVATARAVRRDPAIPMVALATAHPAKFPEAVEAATGRGPALPPALADLMARPEHTIVLPNALARVEDFVRRHARPLGHNSRTAPEAVREAAS
jgi:threonine synthase